MQIYRRIYDELNNLYGGKAKIIFQKEVTLVKETEKPPFTGRFFPLPQIG
jgi:hypothetical protein